MNTKTALSPSCSSGGGGRPLLERIIQKIFQTDLVFNYAELGDCYFRALVEAILARRVVAPIPVIIVMMALKIHQQRPLHKTIRDLWKFIWEELGITKDEAEHSNVPLDFCSLSLSLDPALATSVLSQFTLRMEHLMADNPRIEGFLTDCYEVWLKKVTLPPDGDMGSIVRNLTFLTVRATQRCSDPSSWIKPWTTFLQYDHHVEITIRAWAHYIIFTCRKRKLFSILNAFIVRLCRESATIKARIMNVIESLIDPATVLSLDSPKRTILQEYDPDAAICSRLDGCLQAMGGGALPSFYTIGHLLVAWISVLREENLIDLHDYVNSSVMVGIFAALPEYSSAIRIREEESISTTEPADLLLTLRWAIECPIKKVSFLCLSLVQEKIIQDKYHAIYDTIMDIMWAFLRKLTRVSTMGRLKGTSVGMLAARIIQIIKVLAENRPSCFERAKNIFLPLLLDCDDVLVFGATLELANLVIQPTDLNPMLTMKFLRGYSHEFTFPATADFFYCLIHKIETQSMMHSVNPGCLLVALLPLLLHVVSSGVVTIELLPIMTLLLEGKEGLAVTQRVLQTMGHRQKTTLEMARDLTRIFSDLDMIALGPLTIRTLLLCISKEGLNRSLLLLFLENWLPSLVTTTGSLVCSNTEEDVWDELLESLMVTTEDLNSLLPIVKIIKEKKKTVVIQEEERPVPLRLDAGLKDKLHGTTANHAIKEIIKPIGTRREGRLQPS